MLSIRNALIVIAAGVAVAACSGKQPADAEKAPPDAKPTQAAARTFIVWQTESDSGAKAVLGEIETVMEKADPGLDVQIETVNWNSLSEKMTAAIQTGGLPDLAHIQPFMLTSLVTQDLLLPLTDVATEIGFQPGKTYAALLPMVTRDSETHEEIYGIPYAVGTTFWAYRRDVMTGPPPKTWKDLLAAVIKAHEKRPDLVVLLPGKSPFFIDQLFAELAANNGGRLFNPNTGDPELSSAAVRGVIRFFIDLKATGALDPDWNSQTYQDQFAKYPSERALLTPVTYARAAVAIENRAGEILKETGKAPVASTEGVIGALDQPAGPLYSGKPVATIDCEPYVMFKAAEIRGNTDRARKFLREFFAQKRYVEFVTQVPIHLTPIKVALRLDPQYTGSPILQRWGSWQQHTDSYLTGQGGRIARPILMPGEQDTKLRYLFEFQNEKILSGAVASALSVRPADKSPAAADTLAQTIAHDAQCHAVDLLRRIGSKIGPDAAFECDKEK